MRRLLCVSVLTVCLPLEVLAISWDDAGNSASKLWDDNGNWSPDGDPDNEPVFIGNLANAANDTTLLDRTFAIDSLTITNGADVVNSTDNGATNDFELVVNGHTSVSGTGSSIILFGGDPDGLDTNTLEIGNGGSVILNSTSPQGTAVLEVDGGTAPADFDILSGGTLIGTGRVDLESSLSSPTIVLSNAGAIIANTRSTFVGLAPAAGSLQITANDANARFDWDGIGGGVLQSNGNQTLDIDISPGNDAFSGTMQLATGSTIDIANPWSIDSGTIHANTPAFGLIIIGQDPRPGPAAHIAGADWTMTGGTINVDDKWDSLQFDSRFTATGGTIVNHGTVIFNNTATIGSGATFEMVGPDASLTVADGVTVTINDGDFNLDGTEGSGNITTIGLGALLDINLTVAAAADSYGHKINLNGGELDVVNSGTTSAWSIFSSGVVNAGGGATSTLDGDNLAIFGTIHVAADSTLIVNTTDVRFEGAAINVAAGGNFNNNTIARFESSGFSITGDGVFDPGTFIIGVDETDTADVVWNVATVDLDDGGAKTINAGSSLTINAAAIDPNDNAFNDSVTIGNNAKLTISLTGNAPFVWDTGVLTYNGDASLNVFLGASSSPVEFRATLLVNGDGHWEPRVDFVGATVSINDAGERLRLSGGDQTPGNTNTIDNSTINGPGTLQLDNATALRGNGVIHAVIDDNGSADLIAEGGTLTLGGSIVDIGRLGTSGESAVLHVINPFSTNAATNGVRLNGGQLTGALISNEGAVGIQGFGLVVAQVDNESRIVANDEGTLTLLNQNAALLDGTANAGLLHALGGNLEVVYASDTSVPFHGTVRIDAGREVFGDRTRWNFQAGSTLEIHGGTFRSNRMTQISGSVITTATQTEAVLSNSVLGQLLSTSSMNLGGDLRLVGTWEVASGATFGGGGTLINDAGSTLTLLDGAEVDVLLENRGTLALGTTLGQTTGEDFQQTASGLLQIELSETGLNDYDRLALTGIAQLDGGLEVSLVGGFAPAVDDIFTILTAPGGVLNTFASEVFSAAPLDAGLVWQVLYNATNVQLVVGSAQALPGDYNDDGMVDQGDLDLVLLHWGTVLADPSAVGWHSDLPNGPIDQEELDKLLLNWGSSVALGRTAAVPEPATFVLLLLGIFGSCLGYDRKTVHISIHAARCMASFAKLLR